MQQLHANVAALLSVYHRRKTNSVEIKFKGSKNQVCTVDFSEPIMGSLMPLLMATASQLSSSGRGQVVHLTSARVFNLDDSHAGLELVFDSVRLPVIFSQKDIVVLRNALDELERRSSGSQSDGQRMN